LGETHESQNLIHKQEIENNINNVSQEIENINNDINSKKLKVKEENENIEKLEI
jgi:peptidoglycan hydrolase CwlO-like protein